MNNKFMKKIIVIIAIILTITLLAGCDETQTENPENNISDTGVVFAKRLSQFFPYRGAYSNKEYEAGDLIIGQLEEFGYVPIIEKFGEDENASRNIIVKIPGTGFILNEDEETQEEKIVISRQVIVGAHYDTKIIAEQWETYPSFDGINDNSSGVGTLISIAEELKDKEFGYDIVLVFFGARYDDMAGARHFAQKMTQLEIKETDVMYNIESIYAGDKLYAHAGINSLEEGEKYLRRRKLYELSDIAIASRIDLRFNQSDLDVDVTGDGEDDVYREVTLRKSNYSVFDEMNIPCVFIESFEYFASSLEGQIESKNPYFNETGGMVRNTNNDSLSKLQEFLEEDRLETRIKNTAYLLIKAIERGIYREAIIS